MKGFLFVASPGLESDEREHWVAHGVDYADSLPAKGERKRPTRPSKSRHSWEAHVPRFNHRAFELVP